MISAFPKSLPTHTHWKAPSAKMMRLRSIYTHLIHPRGRQKLEEEALFFKALHQLLDGKVKLPDAVLMSQNILTGRIWQATLPLVAQKIQEGAAFKDALKHAPFSFSDTALIYVEAGHACGDYSLVLKTLSSVLKDRLAAQKRFVAELLYPMTTLLIALFLLIMLVFYWAPTVIPILENLNGGPQAGALSWIKLLGSPPPALGFIFLTGASLCIGGFTLRAKNRLGPGWTNGLALLLPGIGPALILKNILTFTQCLPLFLEARVRHLKALSHSVALMGNPYLRTTLQASLEKDLKQAGAPLSRCLGQIPLPTFAKLAGLLELGENAGRLLPAISLAHGHFTQILEAKITKTLTLLKATVFIISVGIILFILLGAYLPLYTSLGRGALA